MSIDIYKLDFHFKKYGISFLCLCLTISCASKDNEFSNVSSEVPSQVDEDSDPYVWVPGDDDSIVEGRSDGGQNVVSVGEPVDITQFVVAEDTTHIEEQSLCYGRSGVGKRILMVSFSDVHRTSVVQSLARDAAELHAKTGMEFTILHSVGPSDLVVLQGVGRTIDDIRTLAQSLERETNVRHLVTDPQKPISNRTLNDIGNGFYDAIWVISGINSQDRSKKLLAAALTAYRAGLTGMLLHGDGDNLYREANVFMSLIGLDLQFAGSYVGQGYLAKRGFDHNGEGLIHEHPISSGLYQSVSEGLTVANLVGKDVGLIDPILQSTDGSLLAAAYQDPSHGGRVAMHGAFTSLWHNIETEAWGWKSLRSPGTPQFFANMICWAARGEK